MNTDNTRLVQIVHPNEGRMVAVVKEPCLELLENTYSIYDLALDAIEQQQSIENIIASRFSGKFLNYDDIYSGKSEWRLLPSFDHPYHPASCMVSGTGLTHKSSALNRQMMHGADQEKLNDSMRMYQWGLQDGHPGKGNIGVQPEWFYKGNGSVLRAHGEKLEIPCFGNDGGEEPEVAGAYIVDRNGKVWRIGFTTGNEFSDHVMEKKNYLYLAPSKLRNCSIGPELVLTNNFSLVSGTASIARNGIDAWKKNIQSGEDNMAHSLANIEHHHFKYPDHRLPLQAHVHFFGADAFSFGDGFTLTEDDVMIIHWEGFGRPLRNPLHISNEKEKLQIVGRL